MNNDPHKQGAHLATLGTILLAGTVAVLLALPAVASAGQTHVFQETFGSVAQPTVQAPASIAVDQSSGDLYVLEAKAGRIGRYHEDGTPANFSALNATNFIDGQPGEADATPEGFLGFSFSFAPLFSEIAIDESGTETDGDIYVTQNEAEGAQVQLIDIFDSSGAYLGQITGAGPDSFHPINDPVNGASIGLSPCGVSVDPSGNLYVGGGNEEAIYKYQPSANPPTNADLIDTFASPPEAEWPCKVAAGAGPAPDPSLPAKIWVTTKPPSSTASPASSSTGSLSRLEVTTNRSSLRSTRPTATSSSPAQALRRRVSVSTTPHPTPRPLSSRPSAAVYRWGSGARTATST